MRKAQEIEATVYLCPVPAQRIEHWSDLGKMSTRLLAETFDLVVYATLGGGAVVEKELAYVHNEMEAHLRDRIKVVRLPASRTGKDGARETVRGTSELEQL